MVLPLHRHCALHAAAAAFIFNRENNQRLFQCVAIAVLTTFDIAAYYLLLHIFHLQFTAQANKVLREITDILLS